MGSIGLKDIIKDDRQDLVKDKQKRTIKRLLFTAFILAILIVIVIIMIISNNAKATRLARIQQISKDVVNISTVAKGMGQRYIVNNYDVELIGTPLDGAPEILKVNGREVEYRYGYFKLTSKEVEQLTSAINVKGEEYYINYETGDVVNIKGVKDTDGKVYHSLEDIVAIADGKKPTNIIYIHNAEEMAYLRSYPSATFYLSGNIDMATYAYGEGWEPVDNFSGVFDGRDYTISNLNINRPTTIYCGLFGRVTSSAEIKNVNFDEFNIRGSDYTGTVAGSSSGTISNITIKNGQINSQDRYIGGLFGAHDKGTVTDCTVENVNVNGTSSVGGLLGRFLSGTVTRSSSDVIVVGIDSVGGLIGEVTPNGDTIILEDYANASISGQDNVGGLIGNLQVNNGSLFRLNDCYSEGAISGGKTNVGGSIGNVYAVNNAGIDIQSVYTATDTPNSATIRGGFIGKTYLNNISYGYIVKCCYEKDPLLDINVVDIGDKSEGGQTFVIDSKTPAEMMNRVTYSDWNFDIWTLNEGLSRPRLRWQYESYTPQVI